MENDISQSHCSKSHHIAVVSMATENSQKNQEIQNGGPLPKKGSKTLPKSLKIQFKQYKRQKECERRTHCLLFWS